MMRTLFLLALLVGCGKEKSLGQIQKDGYGCTKPNAGASFVPKPGEHCFQCPDDDSFAKCGQNPLTSGCKEVDAEHCGK
jgi:hypothetical protein